MRRRKEEEEDHEEEEEEEEEEDHEEEEEEEGGRGRPRGYSRSPMAASHESALATNTFNLSPILTVWRRKKSKRVGKSCHITAVPVCGKYSGLPKILKC